MPGETLDSRPGQFSFNVEAALQACRGDGVIAIEMRFAGCLRHVRTVQGPPLNREAARSNAAASRLPMFSN
jgi:excinuclease UvrABC ATPase subunit